VFHRHQTVKHLFGWINFTNILRAAFLYASFTLSFFEHVHFLRKNIGAKAALKMSVKLTPG
jgi:hypothetical protein